MSEMPNLPHCIEEAGAEKQRALLEAEVLDWLNERIVAGRRVVVHVKRLGRPVTLCGLPSQNSTTVQRKDRDASTCAACRAAAEETNQQ